MYLETLSFRSVKLCEFLFRQSTVPKPIRAISLALLWKKRTTSIASGLTTEFSINNTLATKSPKPSSSQFVSKENVPDKEFSLRTAVGADSLSGGCKTGKCNCRSFGRLCNSRCHNSTSCKNK
ncbi:hypothetical protein DdX_10595 [Ditylenchus destructor]|uniref:Uncharacterized protein n=1 Tax=Ditylenchus destructor TaxID=166010 RepID=A0AAD4R1Y4_9BILA|nr:hypothetical protein DdX_10595 [Ditylenchus destructor]